MHDRVFTEQDDFARCADEPFSLIFVTTFRFAESKFLNRATDRVALAFQRGTNIMMPVDALFECDSASLKQCMLKIIQKIIRILDTNAKTDQILR